MNFCKDCKHYDAPTRIYPYCRNPEAARNPETGNAFAEFERSIVGNCRKEGKLFEPKPIGFFGRLLGRTRR